MDAVARIDGHDVKLTNLDKVLYPQSGHTKAHVIDYYRRIAPVLLPHVAGRAVTLKRYPDGVEAEHFYEKQCPSHAPPFVRRASIWSRSRGDVIRYCMLNDLASLVWAANAANLEIHSFLALARAPQEPTAMVFDLDPGEGAGLVQCCRVALWTKRILDELGARSYPKTSGSKGIQVYVPINQPGVTFRDTKRLSLAVARLVERENAQRVTTNMAKAARASKVLIDWSQNDAHKTTVSAYSLRARPEPTVSTPLRWSEVEAVADARNDATLPRTPDEALARVAERGDLFDGVLRDRQSLPRL